MEIIAVYIPSILVAFKVLVSIFIVFCSYALLKESNKEDYLNSKKRGIDNNINHLKDLMSSHEIGGQLGNELIQKYQKSSQDSNDIQQKIEKNIATMKIANKALVISTLILGLTEIIVSLSSEFKDGSMKPLLVSAFCLILFIPFFLSFLMLYRYMYKRD